MNFGDPNPSRLDAKSEYQRKIKECLDSITEIRAYFFIETVPEERITTAAPDYTHYKCRSSYHTTARNLADHIIRGTKLTNSEIIQLCKDYINFVKEEISKRNEIIKDTTVADIKRTDLFLTSLESNLQKELQTI